MCAETLHDPQGRVVERDPRRHGAPICTAHWPDGNPCRRIAERGTTKCRRHGGKSLRGVASPSLKHGRYSKFLPAQLRGGYEAARQSPALLSLDDDIALSEARLAQLLGQVETGESAALWQTLRTTLAAFSEALGRGDMAGMTVHFETLQTLVTQGAQVGQTWKEIGEVWQSRTKLVATQVKTLQTLQQMVTREQVVLYMGAITEAVTRVVSEHAEPTQRRAILGDIMVEFEHLANLDAKGR